MSRFSFIIPVYNCGKYLSKCIGSIENVNLQDYEILLIDDGSTDGTCSVCEQFEHQNKNIRYFYQKNQGVSAARNRGLGLATGDYIIFLDADDSIEPGKLRRLIELVEEDFSIDMAIYGLSFDYYYRNKCYRRDELKTPLDGKTIDGEWMAKIIELYDTNVISPIWNKIIKKSVLEDNQLRLREDMFLYEDLEFSLRCMAYCNHIYFFPEVIYHYRQTEDEGNAGRRLKLIEHLPDLIGKIDGSLNTLFVSKGFKETKAQKNEILMKLYLVLAREKISVSSQKETRQICDDFKKWIDSQGTELLNDNGKVGENLLNRRVLSLMYEKIYTKIRHKVAVWVKYKKAMRNENAETTRT